MKEEINNIMSSMCKSRQHEVKIYLYKIEYKYINDI